MADYDSGLPIRSEADGADERVQVKIRDSSNPSMGAQVDADGNLHTEMHGNDPAATDRVLRLSELGALTPDGVYDVSNNTKPGNVGLIASARDAAPSDSTQTQRLTAVTNGTVRSLDIALHDESGAAYSNSNPLPVTISESEGTEVNDYDTTAAVAAAASDNHDYTAPSTFILTQISAAASGKCKVVVQVETAAASGIFNTYFVLFNSTANPVMEKVLREPITVASGAIVRLIRTNNDNQAQDLYSTISGHAL